MLAAMPTLETQPRARRRAPTIPGEPVLGHFRVMRKDPLAFFTGAREAAGDVVRLNFGGLTAHLVSHPDDVRHVLQENHKAYSKQSKGFQKLRLVLGNGLLTSEGDFWRRQRRIAAPAFHHQRVVSFVETMTRATEAMFPAWDRAAAENRPLDVSHEMMKLTLRIVGETLLGADVSRDTDVVGKAVSFVIEDVNVRIGAIVDLPIRVPTPRNREFQRVMATLDGVVNRMIQDRRSGKTTGKDLLQMLVDAKDEDTGERMSDEQLRDEVMTIFLAGHETTANALTWTFHCLSLNPAADRALFAELRELPARSVHASDVPELGYTTMVLKESMRLYPPAWIIGRMTEQADEARGFALPVGGLVFVSPYVTHRHTAFWDNPMGFDPERFSPDKEAARPRFAYFPFGGGPRICIGNGFAMQEAAVVLATLARRYRLDLVPGHPVAPEPLVTLRPKHGMKMHVRRREG